MAAYLRGCRGRRARHDHGAVRARSALADRRPTTSARLTASVADDTLEYLVLYRWPGNVRQLASEMRRMVALAEAGAVLIPEHLSPPIAASRRTLPAWERRLDATEMVVRTDQPLAALVEHVERAAIQQAMAREPG